MRVVDQIIFAPDRLPIVRNSEPAGWPGAEPRRCGLFVAGIYLFVRVLSSDGLRLSVVGSSR